MSQPGRGIQPGRGSQPEQENLLQLPVKFSGEPHSEEDITLVLEPVPLETVLQPTPSTSKGKARAQKRGHDMTMSSFEQKLIGAVNKVMAPPPRSDPDELFLRCLHSDLKALSARRKAAVKLKIQQLIYEA